MKDGSYALEGEEALEAELRRLGGDMHGTNSIRDGLVLSLSRALNLCHTAAPTDPLFRATVDDVVSALGEWNDAPGAGDAVHFVNARSEGSATVRVVGLLPDVSSIEACVPNGTPAHAYSSIAQVLSDHDLAMLSFERGTQRRPFTRFLQLLSGLNEPEKANLPQLLGFSRTDGITALGRSTVRQDAGETGPWLSRVAAARVRSLLQRLPNPDYLEDWLRGGGSELIRQTFQTIASETSLRDTLRSLVDLPAPGPNQNLLELCIRCLPTQDLLGATDAWARDPRSTPLDSRIAWTIGVHLYRIGEAGATNLLKSLHRKGKMPTDSFPEELQGELRVSKWTRAFQEKPYHFLRELSQVTERERFETQLQALHHVYKHLLEGGRYGTAELLVRHLRGLSAPHPFPERPALLKEELGRMSEVSLDPVVDDYLDSSDEGNKGEALTLMASLGPVGLPALLEILCQSSRSDERSVICSQIIRMGPGVHNLLLLELKKTGHPWYFRRNILFILGKIGAPHGYDVIVQEMGDGDVRVVNEASVTLLKIAGRNAWQEVFRAVRDRPEFTLQGIALLSGSGCSQEPFLRYVEELVRRIGERPEETGDAHTVLTSLLQLKRMGVPTERFLPILNELTTPTVLSNLRGRSTGADFPTATLEALRNTTEALGA